MPRSVVGKLENQDGRWYKFQSKPEGRRRPVFCKTVSKLEDRQRKGILLDNTARALLMTWSSKAFGDGMGSRGLPRWCSAKESTYKCRRRKRPGFDSWIGKISWRGNGNSLQYSCLENSMDRGLWLATVHEVTKSWP